MLHRGLGSIIMYSSCYLPKSHNARSQKVTENIIAIMTPDSMNVLHLPSILGIVQ